MTKETFTYSGNVYEPAAGTTTFALTSTDGNAIEYLQKSHIYVYKSTDSGKTYTTLSRPADWDFDGKGTSVVLTSGTTAGDWIKVQRITPYKGKYTTFASSSLLTSDQLNTGEDFSVYVDQEIYDQVGELDGVVKGEAVKVVTGTAPVQVDSTKPQEPDVSVDVIAKADAEKDPTSPSWDTDDKLATPAAIDRVYKQVVGNGAGFPGSGNKAKDGQLRVDNTKADPTLYYWDAKLGSPAWVEVKTKGSKGDKGDQGIQGVPGPAPGLQDPATSVSNVANKPGGQPGDATVSVTQDSGSKDLKFTFGIPVGAKGDAGDGVTYKGAVDATTVAEPSPKKNGDFYVSTKAGTSSWAGTVMVGTRIIYNEGTTSWDTYDPVASQTLQQVCDLGNTTTTGIKAADGKFEIEATGQFTFEPEADAGTISTTYSGGVDNSTSLIGKDKDNKETFRLRTDGEITCSGEIKVTTNDSPLFIGYNSKTDPATETVRISSNGSATFESITSNGKIEADGDIEADGKITGGAASFQGDVGIIGKGGDTTAFFIRDDDQSGDPTTFSVAANGSVGTKNTIICGGDPNGGKNRGSSLSQWGTVRACQTTTASTVFEGYLNKTDKATTTITAGGALTAAGNIISGTPGVTKTGSQLSSAGGVYATAPSGVLFEGYKTDNSTSVFKVEATGNLTSKGTIDSHADVVGSDLFIGGYGKVDNTFVVRGNGTIVGKDTGSASTGSYNYKIDSNGSITGKGTISSNDGENSANLNNGSITIQNPKIEDGATYFRARKGATDTQFMIWGDGTTLIGGKQNPALYPAYTGEKIKLDGDSGAITAEGTLQNKNGNIVANLAKGTLEVTPSDGDTVAAITVKQSTKPANKTVEILSNGSADFKGKIQSGGNPFQGAANGTLLTSSGGCLVSVSSGTSETFLGYTTTGTPGTPVAPTFKVLGNGNAEFAGSISSGDATSDDNVYAYIEPGRVSARNTGTSGVAIWNGYPTGSGSTPSSTINSDGSATFTGTVTAKNFAATDGSSPGRITGEVIAFAGASAPSGWQECNGAEAATDALKTVLGVDNVPDLRGQFIRGLNTSGSGLDPNRTRLDPQDAQGGDFSVRLSLGQRHGADGRSTNSAYFCDGDSGGSSTYTTITSTDENRPANIAMMYIIKT